MKFSDIVRGTRGIKLVPYPVKTGPTPAEVNIGLRALSGFDSADVLENAAKFARDRGSKDPKAGDPLFELGVRVHTLYLACVDPDHPDPESPGARFFPSIAAILEEKTEGSPIFGRDGIAFLYEAQEHWQTQCAPQISTLTDEEAWAKAMEVARSDDPLVFVNMQPGLQWSFVRFMADRLALFLSSKSESGSSSGATTRRTNQKPEASS